MRQWCVHYLFNRAFWKKIGAGAIDSLAVLLPPLTKEIASDFMVTMKRNGLRFFLLLLAFWVTGGQWLMLQSVAWVNMARTYSQETTWSKALTQTFDGNHPCRLCRFIQKEKAAESTPAK